MKKVQAFLVLECNGRTEHGFRYCNCVKNKILTLHDLDDETYEASLKTFNSTKLFDCKLEEYNSVANTLNFIHKQHQLFDPVTIEFISNFIRLHKQCGLKLYFTLKENYVE